ncbi:hypothetical protein [Clostridium gasigenes]|nr:hypothetical protein [Clostridium gasigenes]
MKNVAYNKVATSSSKKTTKRKIRKMLTNFDRDDNIKESQMTN